MPKVDRQFVARAIYHHAKRTSEHVTLLAYKDSRDAYQLLDDRETEHEYLAGTKEYILEEWGKRNRQVIKAGFQRDNLAGENEFQQFI
jgi:hypothetical protein